MSNQYLKSVKRSLRSHNQEPQNSTLTEKTKEPLVHSEVDNSQEKEKQAGIQQQAEANFVVQENASTSEFIRKIGEEASYWSAT